MYSRCCCSADSTSSRIARTLQLGKPFALQAPPARPSDGVDGSTFVGDVDVGRIGSRIRERAGRESRARAPIRESACRSGPSTIARYSRSSSTVWTAAAIVRALFDLHPQAVGLE
jgi:hypothetical protein